MGDYRSRGMLCPQDLVRLVSMLTGQAWTWSQKDVGSELSAATGFFLGLRQLFNLFES